MKLFAPLSNTLSRLSPREQLLLGVALVIGFTMIALYGVRFPGEAAARSAASRNLQAASELAEARTLPVGSETVVQSDAALLARLTALAVEHGVTIIDSRAAEGALVLGVTSPGSREALAWAAEASRTAAPLRSLSITQGAAARLAIEVSFAGVSS